MARKLILATASIVAIALFIGLLIYAAKLTDAGTPQGMPATAIWISSSVNALLLANLATVLGIGALSSAGFRQVFTDDHTAVQGFVAIAYFVLLVIVLLYWWSLGFEEDPEVIVESIPEIGRSGAVIIIAALGTALGAKGSRAAVRTG